MDLMEQWYQFVHLHLRNYQVEYKRRVCKTYQILRVARKSTNKNIEAIQNPSVSYRYSFDQENFSKIPGSPIAYWVSEKYD